MASSFRLNSSEWWSKWTVASSVTAGRVVILTVLQRDESSAFYTIFALLRVCVLPRKAAMSSHRTTFNHVGLCVSDRERSRRFYESVLGFQFWWELDPPDGPTAKLVQLSEPLGVHATYLVREGLVLELMDYSERQVHTGSERVMDQIGLTHISFSVSDLPGALEKVQAFGGSDVDGT